MDIREVLAGIEDIGMLRPWLDDSPVRKTMVTIKGVTYDCYTDNSVPDRCRVKGILTQEQWMAVDKEVNKQIKYRTPLVNELIQNQHLFTEYHGGLGKVVIEEAEATQSTSGHPTFNVVGMALPIIWKEVPNYDELVKLGDMMQFGMAARRVGEGIEQYLIDSLRNHRLTHRWSDDSQPTLDEMMDELYGMRFYGPYTMVHSEQADYLDALGTTNVKSPLLRRSEMLLFQSTADVIRMVIGLHPTTIFWDGKFVIAAVVVPQIRHDMKNNLAVCHRKP